MPQNKRDYDASDDTRLAELAVAQHGVVSRPQLTELGYSRTQVQRCLDRHRWHRIQRGVYAVGHTRLTAQGRWMAAVLACGPGALLSHVDAAALHAVIARSPGRHGIQPLTDALQQVTDDEPWLQSQVERVFRDLIRAHGFPDPQFNVYVEGELVDVVWPAFRLVVEVDGWAFHRGKRSFANDRTRDRTLVKAGWRVFRFTAEEVMCRPDAVAAEISAVLRRGAPWPPPATPDP